MFKFIEKRNLKKQLAVKQQQFDTRFDLVWELGVGTVAGNAVQKANWLLIEELKELKDQIAHL